MLAIFFMTLKSSYLDLLLQLTVSQRSELWDFEYKSKYMPNLKFNHFFLFVERYREKKCVTVLALLRSSSRNTQRPATADVELCVCVRLFNCSFIFKKIYIFLCNLPEKNKHKQQTLLRGERYTTHMDSLNLSTRNSTIYMREE